MTSITSRVAARSAMELMHHLARERRSIHRGELVKGIEYLSSLPDGRKCFRSIEMEALHAIIVYDVRSDRGTFETIIRYMSACKTTNYINVELYSALSNKLSSQHCPSGTDNRQRQLISCRNLVSLLNNVVGVKPIDGRSTVHHYRAQAQLFNATVGCLKRNPPRRLSVGDAGAVCEAITMAYTNGLVENRNWTGSDACVLLKTSILPQLISLPPSSFAFDTITLVLRGCSILPGLCHLGLELLHHYLPLLLDEYKSLEAWQISVILSSIMQLYRDEWIDTYARELGGEIACERCILATRLIRGLMSRKHDPSELARIALGVVRLLPDNPSPTVS